jgi:hypothetical protein
MAIDPETGAQSALTDLTDDNVKLVAYTIVSLKRDKERIMEGGKDSMIVIDNLTDEAFVGSILAKYLQQSVPDPANPGKTILRSQLYKKELKYLRVYYVVSHRWPREPIKFEEREIDVLQGIRNNLSTAQGGRDGNA